MSFVNNHFGGKWYNVVKTIAQLFFFLALLSWVFLSTILHNKWGDTDTYERYVALTFQIIVVSGGTIICILIYEGQASGEEIAVHRRFQETKLLLDKIDSINMRRGKGNDSSDYAALSKQLNQLSTDLKKNKSTNKNIKLENT